jgi:hypothetical protein
MCKLQIPCHITSTKPPPTHPSIPNNVKEQNLKSRLPLEREPLLDAGNRYIGLPFSPVKRFDNDFFRHQPDSPSSQAGSGEPTSSSAVGCLVIELKTAPPMCEF